MFKIVKSKDWLKVYGMDYMFKIGKIVGWNLCIYEVIEVFIDYCEKNVYGECLSNDFIFKKCVFVVENVFKEFIKFIGELF